jgi:hypothetical protein
MSRASTSAVRRAKAFLDPSGLENISMYLEYLEYSHIPDKGIDLDGIDIIELLQCLLDLSLIGLDINDENKGVVLLNLLHRTLSIERVDDNLVLIETGLVGDRLAWELGRSGELEGLGSVEGSRFADLSDLVRVNLDDISI